MQPSDPQFATLLLGGAFLVGGALACTFSVFLRKPRIPNLKPYFHLRSEDGFTYRVPAICEKVSAQGEASTSFYEALYLAPSEGVRLEVLVLDAARDGVLVKFPFEDAFVLGRDECLRLEVKVQRSESGEKQHKCVCVTRKEARNGLVAAVEANDLATMRTLLSDGANPNEGGHSHGWTPLHLAAKWGLLEITAELLEAGANFNASTTGGHGDRVGETPLHLAVKKGHYSVAKLLLEAGADVNAQCWVMRTNSRLDTPLDFASRLNDKQIEKLIESAGGRAAVQP